MQQLLGSDDAGQAVLRSARTIGSRCRVFGESRLGAVAERRHGSAPSRKARRCRNWLGRCGRRSPAWPRTPVQVAGRTGDDLEHLAGRGLLFQRFGEIVGALAQLVEQPRVLDGDDGLGGEVLHQLDLLVGERPHLLAGRSRSAPTSSSSLSIGTTRRAGAAEFAPRDWARSVGDPSATWTTWRLCGDACREIAIRRRLERPAARPNSANAAGMPLMRRAKLALRVAKQNAELRPANAHRVASIESNTGTRSPGELEMTLSTSEVAVCCSSDSVRSSVRWRSSLSSRVFSMAMTACAAKFCHQLDLLVGERSHLLAVDGNGANQIAFLEHRHDHQRPVPPSLDRAPGHRLRSSIVAQIWSLTGCRLATARRASGRRYSVPASPQSTEEPAARHAGPPCGKHRPRAAQLP